MPSPSFKHSHKRRIGEAQHRLAAAAADIRQNGLPSGSEAGLGSRLLPDLNFIHEGADVAPSFPPAYFAAFENAILEGVPNEETRTRARASLAEADDECAAVIKGRFKALSGLGLGSDDLFLVAREGQIMAMHAASESRDLSGADLSRMTLLDRVRAKLSQPEIKRLSADAKDFSPFNETSPRAVALMVLRAAESRSRGQHAPLYPYHAPFSSEPAVRAPGLALIKQAASMSQHYQGHDLETLRGLVAASGQDIPLSADAQAEEELSFSWMRRARG